MADIGDLLKYNSGLPNDPLCNNILLFGYSGSGVSSYINTLITALQPIAKQTLVKNISKQLTPPAAAHKTRMTTTLTKLPMSTYLSGLKLNLWESWGVAADPKDGNNYETLELDLLLKGFLPERFAMPNDTKTLLSIISGMKKPNHLNTIHAAAFFVPQSVLTDLKGAEIARIKSVLAQIQERGRDPVVVVTKVDQLLVEREGDGLAIHALGASRNVRKLAANLLGVPSENVFCMINYNSAKYSSAQKRVSTVDTEAVLILKHLLQQCELFLANDPSMLAMKNSKSNIAPGVERTSVKDTITKSNTVVASEKTLPHNPSATLQRQESQTEAPKPKTTGLQLDALFLQVQEEMSASDSGPLFEAKKVAAPVTGQSTSTQMATAEKQQDEAPKQQGQDSVEKPESEYEAKQEHQLKAVDSDDLPLVPPKSEAEEKAVIEMQYKPVELPSKSQEHQVIAKSFDEEVTPANQQATAVVEELKTSQPNKVTEVTQNSSAIFQAPQEPVHIESIQVALDMKPASPTATKPQKADLEDIDLNSEITAPEKPVDPKPALKETLKDNPPDNLPTSKDVPNGIVLPLSEQQAATQHKETKAVETNIEKTPSKSLDNLNKEPSKEAAGEEKSSSMVLAEFNEPKTSNDQKITTTSKTQLSPSFSTLASYSPSKTISQLQAGTDSSMEEGDIAELPDVDMAVNKSKKDVKEQTLVVESEPTPAKDSTPKEPVSPTAESKTKRKSFVATMMSISRLSSSVSDKGKSPVMEKPTAEHPSESVMDTMKRSKSKSRESISENKAATSKKLLPAMEESHSEVVQVVSPKVDKELPANPTQSSNLNLNKEAEVVSDRSGENKSSVLSKHKSNESLKSNKVDIPKDSAAQVPQSQANSPKTAWNVKTSKLESVDTQKQTVAELEVIKKADTPSKAEPEQFKENKTAKEIPSQAVSPVPLKQTAALVNSHTSTTELNKQSVKPAMKEVSTSNNDLLLPVNADARLNALESAQAKAVTETTTLRTLIQSSKDNLAAEISLVQRQYTELQYNLGQTESELAGVKNEVPLLRQSLKNLSADAVTMDAKLKALTAKVEALDQTYNEKLSGFESRFAAEWKGVDGRVLTLEKSLETNLAKVGELQRQEDVRKLKDEQEQLLKKEQDQKLEKVQEQVLKIQQTMSENETTRASETAAEKLATAQMIEAVAQMREESSQVKEASAASGTSQNSETLQKLTEQQDSMSKEYAKVQEINAKLLAEVEDIKKELQQSLKFAQEALYEAKTATKKAEDADRKAAAACKCVIL